MKILFVMDPIEEVNIDRDSTFFIMLAAQKRGYEVWYTLPNQLWAEDNNVYGNLTKLKVEKSSTHYQKLETTEKSLLDFDAVFMRKDPPFDMEYINSTYLLSIIKDRVLVVNDPDGIRNANEKVFILNFPELITKTLVTKNKKAISNFLVKSGGKIVLKPLGKRGGEGIFIVTEGDKNTQTIIDVSTEEGHITV
ncbi:MAG: glutathione synthase, partial [Candidatus Sericytochromatia bacterium]